MGAVPVAGWGGALRHVSAFCATQRDEADGSAWSTRRQRRRKQRSLYESLIASLPETTGYFTFQR